MKISDQKIVVIDYILTDENGDILDKSDDGSFAYLHGAGNIVIGLENALVGKSINDGFSVSVPPAEAYGERNPGMQQTVSIEMFDDTKELEVGRQFHAQSPDGEAVTVTIAAIEDDSVTIDGNHPLAGKTLNFNVKVIDIRDASEEEISHGHVHGSDGHHHD